MSDWLFLGCDSNTCKAHGSDILEMDKELKKTIDTLSASIKAIQADLLTLKGDCEVAHSDNNSQSSSRYSDLVSGNGPTKKRRRILKEESESDGEDGKFKQKDTDSELYQLSEAGGVFIETTLKSKLDNTTRKARATKYGCQTQGG